MSRPVRILEVGGDALFHLEHPEITARLWANLHVDHRNDPPLKPWRLGEIAGAFRAVASDDLELLVWHQLAYAPWDPRYLGRMLAKLGPLALPVLVKQLAAFLLVWRCRAPIIVIDAGDCQIVGAHTVWAMKRARVELQARVAGRPLAASGRNAASALLPTRRMRGRAGLKATLERLRPISLGATWQPNPLLPEGPAQKTTDIFFAGDLEANSTVRDRGMVELRALAARGFVVDIAEGRIARDEFYRRCAQAWLVWSPEGHGWDCYRHYEAPLCWSVPLINRPTIERYRPLEHGVTCIFYDLEPGALTAAAEAALADKAALARIAGQAHDFVAAHHVRAAGCRYVLAESGLDPDLLTR